MNWATAQAGIDLLLDNSSASELPALGFYGGEPFLEWPLLRKSIEYARVRTKGRALHIAVTTNGTRVTEESARFLAQRDVAVLVSLDGPAEVHDRFRRLRRSRQSAYAHSIEGLRLLRSAYGGKGIRRIRINAVCGPWTDFGRLQSFFEHPPAELEGLAYRLSTVSHPNLEVLMGVAGYSGDIAPVRQGLVELESEWRDSLAKADIDVKRGSFLRALFEDEMIRLHKRSTEPLGEKIGLMGMCVPGVEKVYVDADGRLLPCERVSEAFAIGNVAQGGFDISLWERLMQPIVSFCRERCIDCIFCRLCSGCLTSFVDTEGRFSPRALEAECARQKAQCADKLVRYVRAVTSNSACFDYMKDFVLS